MRTERAAQLARLAPTLAILAIAVALPLQVTKSFDLARLELTLMYMTAAMALNFAYGYAGQLALGEPVLVGAAAYAAGIASQKWGWEIHQTVWLALGITFVVSVLLGLPSLRVRGWYFAVLTFFGILVFPDVLVAYRETTGGEDGLVGIAPMMWNGTFLSGAQVYEVVLAGAVITWIMIRNAVKSGWGLSLQAMRDHPAAASASGLSVGAAKARVYLLIAVPCALAGVTFAHSSQFLAPEQFGFNMILLLIGGVFIGGFGTLWGPIVGVALFQGISLWIGPFSKYNSLVLGIGVLASAVLFRGGLVPAFRRLGGWVWGRVGRGGGRSTPAVVDHTVATDASALDPIDAAGVGMRAGDVRKAFGANLVLRDVDVEVRGGEVVGLVGANGSGKTTLLNVVNGFYPIDGGRVEVNGTDVTGKRVRAVAHAGLGRTFQVPRLVDELSVRQNVEFGIAAREPQRALSAIFRLPGFRRRERDRAERARAICRMLGFDDAASDAPAGNLSLGMKRIVEIGRAIAGDASVICLDEPAAGLNDDERERLGETCTMLARSGRAVLLVEHHLRFVLDICDEVVLLKDGVVAGRGCPREPASMTRELETYLGTYLVDFRAAAGEPVGSPHP